MDDLLILTARIDTASGRQAAYIQMVDVGGGEQVVTVDGQPEIRVHPSSRVFHVRFISPDRMVPDTLREAASFDEAVALGRKYAAKLDEHAKQVDTLAGDLEV